EMIVTPASLRSCAANAVTFGPLPEARSRESAQFYFCTGPARCLLCGGRQELVVGQGLQRVATRVLGVNRLCASSLAQLDGAHEGPRSFRGAVGEREVRVLVPRQSAPAGSVSEDRTSRRYGPRHPRFP